MESNELHKYFIIRSLKYINFLRYVTFKNLFSTHIVKYKFKKLPVCKQPIYFTGKGEVKIGANCHFGFSLGGYNKGGYLELQARDKNSKISIGNQVAFNNNVFICAMDSIMIGEKCRIGQGVTMIDHEAHQLNPKLRHKIGVIQPIQIGSNAWIGNAVQFLKGSGVGNNSIVGAGAIVTKNFPDNVVIAGVPAKIIKYFE